MANESDNIQIKGTELKLCSWCNKLVGTSHDLVFGMVCSYEQCPKPKKISRVRKVKRDEKDKA